jgi:hypothetical protein
MFPKHTNNFFFWGGGGKLGYITYGIREKRYSTRPEQGHISCLVYILIYIKLINLMITNRKPFLFCVNYGSLGGCRNQDGRKSTTRTPLRSKEK